MVCQIKWVGLGLGHANQMVWLEWVTNLNGWSSGGWVMFNARNFRFLWVDSQISIEIWACK